MEINFRGIKISPSQIILCTNNFHLAIVKGDHIFYAVIDSIQEISVINSMYNYYSEMGNYFLVKISMHIVLSP